MLSLDDAVLRLQRGEKQRDNLLAQLSDFLRANPLKLEFKLNPQSEAFEYSLYVIDVPEIGKDIGILLGEAIQSFRISLDYLTWALVEASGKKITESEERNVAFPMADTREWFERNVDKYLPNIFREQLSIIERYQPYQNSELGYAIKYLKTLSNTDKHRIIVPVLVSPLGLEAKLRPVGAHILKLHKDYRDGQELRSGDKILTILMDGKPEKWQAKMELQAVPVVPHSMIEPPPQYALVTLEKVFEIIQQTCFAIISEFKYSEQ